MRFRRGSTTWPRDVAKKIPMRPGGIIWIVADSSNAAPRMPRQTLPQHLFSHVRQNPPAFQKRRLRRPRPGAVSDLFDDGKTRLRLLNIFRTALHHSASRHDIT
jgi:hypothetical protein